MKLYILVILAQMVMGIMPCSVLVSLRQLITAINMSPCDSLTGIWARIVVYCRLLITGPDFLSFCQLVWPVAANKEEAIYKFCLDKSQTKMKTLS